jgi:hypothetical protein
MAIGICLSLAALAVAPTGEVRESVFVNTQRFTLAWVHSIEKVRWEEDYAVVPGEGAGKPPVLNALAARVKGSAAGMEPGPDAVLKDGWYVYKPAQQTHEVLRLSRSFYTPDYELCIKERCMPMAAFLKSDGGVTTLRACESPALK